MLTQNKEILKKRFPLAWEQIQASDALADYRLEAPFELSGTLPYGKQNEATLLKRWLKAIGQAHPRRWYFTDGFGNGSHLKAFLDKHGEQVCLFVTEKDPGLLKTLFERKDYSALLSHPNFFLGLGADMEAAFESAVSDHYLKMNDLVGIKHLIFSPINALDPLHAERNFQKFSRYVSHVCCIYQTQITSGGLMQRNSMTSLQRLLESPDISALENKFKNIPMVIAAAGPSLDESIEFLKKARDHALIVSVNSSHRKLMNHGIVPHLTVAYDLFEGTYKGYKDLDNSGTFLVSGCCVYPKVLELFPNNLFHWSGGNRLLQWIRSKLNLPKSTSVSQRGTVTVSCMDLARIMGCGRICLVGQDLSLGPQGQSHTFESFYEAEGTNREELLNCNLIEGNVFNQVPIPKKMYSYKCIIEGFFKDYPELGVINTARFGVKIDGIPYMDYEAALDWLGAPHERDLDQQIRDAYQKNCPTQIDHAYAVLDDALLFARKLTTLTQDALFYSNWLPESLAEAKHATHPHIEKAKQQVEDLNDFIEQNLELYQLICAGKGQQLLLQCMRYQEKVSALSEHWSAILRNRHYFKALNIAAQDFIQCLQCAYELEPESSDSNPIAP